MPAVLLGQGQLPPDLSLVSPWMTIFTSMFMHGGWMHLIGNMLNVRASAAGPGIYGADARRERRDLGLQLLSNAMAQAGQGGVAFRAHIGGFVAGMILIPLFKQRRVRLRMPWG